VKKDGKRKSEGGADELLATNHGSEIDEANGIWVLS
jgi:hypothetical protein